jgi:hypothetical protein
MSTTTVPADASPLEPRPTALLPARRRLAVDPSGREARERDQMLERLQKLRGVLPVLAKEMAAARRQAARLRTENRRLSEQVRQLRAALDAREHRAA